MKYDEKIIYVIFSYFFVGQQSSVRPKQNKNMTTKIIDLGLITNVN